MIKTTNNGFVYQLTRTSVSSFLVQSKYGRFTIFKASGDTWELWEITEDKTTWKEKKTLIKRSTSGHKALEASMVDLCHQRMESSFKA